MMFTDVLTSKRARNFHLAAFNNHVYVNGYWADIADINP
jgi:hypothetical protein